VRSRLMIIDTAGFQMPFIYDDNVIQTLSPYGPDNSLDIWILPRRARGSRLAVRFRFSRSRLDASQKDYLT
jgi:hypothetical protein